MSSNASSVADPKSVDAFLARWSPSGGSERSNYALFFLELCDVLGVPRPMPSTGIAAQDTYVVDKPITFTHGDGSASPGFIDLYKRGCFVCETKQGVEAKRAQSEADALAAGQAREATRRRGHGVRGTKGWDDAMLAARGQAEGYVRAIPDDNPPFIVVMDVGYSIELYADFSRLGKVYAPFPDAQSHRLKLDQLKDPAVFNRLRALWLDPLSLDPTRKSAEATRQIAEQLATLSQSLEKQGHHPEQAAQFLMRCLFTAFAEDVELLPKGRFTELLKELAADPDRFPHELRGIWRAMDKGEYSPALKKQLLKFNGGLFADADALPLNGSQIHILHEAAARDWQHVEPAIFGTLLERALNVDERHKLGAHFTPRAYVERLVLPTIIEPLREELDAARTAALAIANRPIPPDIHPGTKLYDTTVAKQNRDARAEVYAFLKRLCDVKVLDPACGTGNFLYVAMARMKDLEGEANDLLRQLGDDQYAAERQGLTVDPHQFLGIEINPRAVAIAELVLWIGYLQWHFRTHGNTAPAEPVLRDFDNIRQGDAVLAYDRKELVLDAQGKPVTRWDGKTMKPHPVTGEDVPDESARVPVYRYVNPRKAEWPKADFVVGNPPFLGKLWIQSDLGPGYADALRRAYEGSVPDAADFVMYWWHKAAVATATGDLKRFGLITTNSITQAFNRKLVAAALASAKPVRLAYVVPDHPWVDSSDGAGVRIAMTVGSSDGQTGGQINEVVSESDDAEGVHEVVLVTRAGRINADLTIGADTASAKSLKANDFVASMGPALGSRGFVVDECRRSELVQSDGEAAALRIRPLRNGKDLIDGARGVYAIDLHGIESEDELRRLMPAVYQHLHATVYPERSQNNDRRLRENWWLFRRSNEDHRQMLEGLPQFVVTVETAKHRIFFLCPAGVVCEHGTISFGLADAYFLGVMSSSIHSRWALQTGGTLEDRPRYNKTLCFDPFPFPIPTGNQTARIRELAEQLDAHRKRQQAAHPGLTITDMYNVLEKLRGMGVPPMNTGGTPVPRPDLALTAKEKKIHEQGLISVLKQIHDELDAAVFEAYGWPADLSDEQILERLVALNAERAAEEARGLIRWLRPEFQQARAGGAAATGEESDDAANDDDDAPDADAPKKRAAKGKSKAKSKASVAEPTKPAKKAAKGAKVAKRPWPATLAEQARAVREALAAEGGTARSAADLAKRFTRGNADRIAEILDTLATLGQARRDGDRYRAS